MGVKDADPIAEREFDLASRWAAIVESSADAIIGGSLDGTITSWNPGAKRMYGYAAEEIIGCNGSVLVPPGQASMTAPVLNRLRRGERIAPFETKVLGNDGSIIDVSVSISPIHDARGWWPGCRAWPGT